MIATLLYTDRPPARVTAQAEGENLWLGAGALEATTGWALTSDGIARDERHVQLPHGRAHELVRGARVNLTALARLLEQPVLREEAHAVWCIAEAAPARRAAMQSLRAPDFTLPDLEGRPRSLAEFRGRKVFLVSWASW